MSFFDLKGTGELHCDKTKRIVEVDLVIQAVNGRTRIHYSLVDINEPFDLHDFSFTAHNPSLKNVKSRAPPEHYQPTTLQTFT